MVTLNIFVFLFLLFWSHSSPQMFHSQHQVEQSCSLIEQRILGILRAHILDVSIKEATSKVIKDILQTTVQHFQSSIQEITAKVDSLEDVIETLERRIPESQETILQNLQSSIQKITAKVDSQDESRETILQILQSSIQEISAKVGSLEGVIATLERRIPESQETILQNLQSSIQEITAKVGSQEGVIATLERRIPESHETILQNLQSSIQEITAKVGSLEGKIETLERRIPESQETILQNLQSSIQEMTAKVDSLEGMIATLEGQIPEFQETILQKLKSRCTLLVSKLVPLPHIEIFEERCYFYRASQLNWNAAQETCQSAGGNLVTVSSLSVQKFLERFIPFSSRWQHVWIGGTDSDHEGSFVWIGNGMNFNYGFQHWSDEEPSNKDGNEHCVEIVDSPLLVGKFWNDNNCGNEQRFVCEI